MADREDDPARRQVRRRGALFRRRAGAGLGATAGRRKGQAMSGRLAVVGLGPGDPRYLTPEAADGACGRRGALRLRALSRPRAASRRPEPPSVRQPRGKRARRRRAALTPRKARSVAVVSGGDPGVFAMAAAICEEIEAGPDELARARCGLRSRHYRHARRRGDDRRAARPRFLRAVAVRQSQALGPGRAPARCRGERRLCHRALQSGVAGAAVAVRQRHRAAAPASAARQRRSCSAAPSAGRTRPSMS